MKETFYFPHDYNASQDPKIISLLTTCGLSGLGVYWILIEILHQEPTNKISTQSFVDYINFYSKFDSEQVLNKIQQELIRTGLLLKEGEFIFSKRVLDNKKHRENISEKRSKAGKRSAELRYNLTNVQQLSNKTQQEKERKGKEIKEKELREGVKKFTPPAYEEIKKYCEERNNGINAQQFLDYYTARGWIIGKNKMKDWQACVRTWEQRNKTNISISKEDEVINQLKQKYAQT